MCVDGNTETQVHMSVRRIKIKNYFVKQFQQILTGQSAHPQRT